MITVTEDARTVLSEMLTQTLDEIPTEVRTPEPGIRLIVQQGELSLALDHAQEQDEVVEMDGHKVLIVAPEIGVLLDGSTVDVEHSANGDRLTISRV